MVSNSDGCNGSVTYTNNGDDLNLPHYLVKLSERDLSNFEVLNSMFLLDDYNNLLYFLESQIEEFEFAVPPYDIVIVLLTLCTVSSYYKEPLIRNNDMYNITRQQLSKRAIKLLQKFIQILKDFNVNRFDRYKMELLRCQFFLAIDSFNIRRSQYSFDRVRRSRTPNAIVYTELSIEEIESTSEKYIDIMENPYKSYHSSLKQKVKVLDNMLVNTRLSKQGEFINMILWTLSNSVQKNEILFISSHDVWIPLLDIILDIFDLRHSYFVERQIEKDIENSLKVQLLGNSPLALLLKSLDSMQLSQRLSEYIFINLSYQRDDSYNTYLHPVYYEENKASKTYIPRTIFSEEYKYSNSMALRRKFIGICFKLLLNVPQGHKLVSPRLVPDDFIKSIVSKLCIFDNLDQFKAFFYTTDLSQELFFIPLLAEMTIIELFNDMHSDLALQQIQLVDYLDNVDMFFENAMKIIEDGFFIPPILDEESDSDSSSDVESDEDKGKVKIKFVYHLEKLDICFAVLLRYVVHLTSDIKISQYSQHFEEFKEAAQRIDMKRKAINSEYSSFYQKIQKVLSM